MLLILTYGENVPSLTISLDYATLQKVQIYKDNEMCQSMSDAIRKLIVSGFNYAVILKKQKEEQLQ